MKASEAKKIAQSAIKFNGMMIDIYKQIMEKAKTACFYLEYFTEVEEGSTYAQEKLFENGYKVEVVKETDTDAGPGSPNGGVYYKLKIQW